MLKVVVKVLGGKILRQSNCDEEKENFLWFWRNGFFLKNLAHVSLCSFSFFTFKF